MSAGIRNSGEVVSPPSSEIVAFAVPGGPDTVIDTNPNHVPKTWLDGSNATVPVAPGDSENADTPEGEMVSITSSMTERTSSIT